jgi:hypothetical protein
MNHGNACLSENDIRRSPSRNAGKTIGPRIRGSRADVELLKISVKDDHAGEKHQRSNHGDHSLGAKLVFVIEFIIAELKKITFRFF